MHLYPPIKTYAVHELPVDDIHTLYIEESGSPDGIPVLVVHGGPGAGTTPDDRRFFNPERYRIVLFDQRGAGRSTPHASVEQNTTWHLVEDIEKIRQHLNVEQWMLCSGSWGSALAILYAQRYPDYVRAMIVRSVFLATRRETDWFFRNGAPRVFPDLYHQLLLNVPEDEWASPAAAFTKRVFGEDQIASMAATKALSEWIMSIAMLEPNHLLAERLRDVHHIKALCRLSLHYLSENYFLTDDQILHNMERIAHIPAIIIHGRYDMVCPTEGSYLLHAAWPGSRLDIVRDAGHSLLDSALGQAVVAATDELAGQLLAG